MSHTRLAEVGEQAVAYVQEEAEDVFQDLTERLGSSMEEVSLLAPTYRFLAASSSGPLKISALSNRILNAKQRSKPQLSKVPEHSLPTFK